MAGKKLHCLFGIKDDLHEFAEAAINTLPLCAMNAPLTWCQDFGSVQAGILHRDDNFQIEQKSNLKTSCYQIHITELNKAIAMDSNARHLKTLENHRPEWIQARGNDTNYYDPFGRNR